MSVLSELLVRLHNVRGADYFATRDAIRKYIHALSDEEFTKEIEDIVKDWMVGYLTHIGLPKAKWYIFTAYCARKRRK